MLFPQIFQDLDPFANSERLAKLIFIEFGCRTESTLIIRAGISVQPSSLQPARRRAPNISQFLPVDPYRLQKPPRLDALSKSLDIAKVLAVAIPDLDLTDFYELLCHSSFPVSSLGRELPHPVFPDLCLLRTIPGHVDIT